MVDKAPGIDPGAFHFVAQDAHNVYNFSALGGNEWAKAGKVEISSQSEI